MGRLGTAPERTEPLCERSALLPGGSCALARRPASPAPEVSCSEAPPGLATSEAWSCRRCRRRRRRNHGECLGPGSPSGVLAVVAALPGSSPR